MTARLLNKDEQTEALEAAEQYFSRSCDKEAKNFNFEKSLYKFGQYSIWLYADKDEWLGFLLRDNLCLTKERDLQFTIYSPRSGVGEVAAAFASLDNEIILVHDGRVYTRDGRAKPTSQNTIIIDEKPYYVVSSRVGKRGFIDDLIQFQESRRNPYVGVECSKITKLQSNGRDGFDPGVKIGGERRAGDFEARQRPIVEALWAYFKQDGFEIAKTTVVRPDLAVEKDGKRYLFEVKADSTFGSICEAIGQVICYSADNDIKNRCIVSSKLADSPHAKILRAVMKDHNIFYIEYEIKGDGIEFPNISRLKSKLRRS